MGLHQQGRSGLGLSKPPLIPPKGTHDYRKFISDLADDIEKESDLAKTAQLHLQGSWLDGATSGNHLVMPSVFLMLALLRNLKLN